MHDAAREWVSRYASAEPVIVLEIGSRNINGTIRDLFPHADYTGLDIAPGDGVDIVADASVWTPDRVYDVVVCCEVFEHTALWQQICKTAFEALRPGGRLIVTMAGPGRLEHSAVDGGQLQPGEHYANIEPADLERVLTGAGFAGVVVDFQAGPADTRAFAHRPGR